MGTKKRIVEIKAVSGATIDKGVKTYSAPIIYVLEDGTEIGSSYRRQRKRDVKAFLDTLPAPPRNTSFACFDKDGHFYGIEEIFVIGYDN